MNNNDNYKPMTIGGWLLTWLLLALPVVNIVFIILWLCGVGNRSRVTCIRSFLVMILIVIGIILTIIAIGYAFAHFATAKSVSFLSRLSVMQHKKTIQTYGLFFLFI